MLVVKLVGCKPSCYECGGRKQDICFELSDLSANHPCSSVEGALKNFCCPTFFSSIKKTFEIFFLLFIYYKTANKEIGAMKCASFLCIIMLYFVSLLHSNIQLNYDRFENAIDIIWIITLVYMCTYQAECLKLWKL